MHPLRAFLLVPHWTCILSLLWASRCSALKFSFVLHEVLDFSAHVQHGAIGVVHQFWWVGALATMVGATLTIAGLMIQKESHQHNEGKEATFYWARGRWLLGLLVWIVGQLICWTADGLANRSVLACFNCWNIVVVLVFGPWYLRESVGRLACLGATITFAGCIWVVLAGPRSYHTQTVETLEDSWLDTLFLGLVGASFLGAVGLTLWARRARYCSTLLPTQLAAVSAIFAWYAVLLSKCASTLTVTSVRSKSQFGYWQFWLYLVLMAVFAVAQVHALNMALRIGKAVVVLPVYESLSMIGQIIICGVFFREFRGFDMHEFAHFFLAVCSVLGGIAIMAVACTNTPDELREEGGPAVESHVFAGRKHAGCIE